MLITEALLYFSSAPFFQRYRKLQFVKMRMVLVEMLALAVLCHGAKDLGMVARVLILTASSR
jgi:hypothetical protein